MAISKGEKRLRVKRGIRKKISGSIERPRLSVFKSNTAIYAQLINDRDGQTLAQASSKELGSDKTVNIEVSKKVGQKLAEKAKGAGYTDVVFDRNGNPYHGKVKALAEGAREGGLKF